MYNIHNGSLGSTFYLTVYQHPFLQTIFFPGSSLPAPTLSFLLIPLSLSLYLLCWIIISCITFYVRLGPWPSSLLTLKDPIHQPNTGLCPGVLIPKGNLCLANHTSQTRKRQLWRPPFPQTQYLINHQYQWVYQYKHVDSLPTSLS